MTYRPFAAPLERWWQRRDRGSLIRRIRGPDSQAAFAKRLSCTVAALSRWENGHVVPGPVFRALLEKLARQRRVKL